MEKVFISRLTECGVPNKNGIIYSEEEFNKAITDQFNISKSIPVTIGLSGNPTIEDICTVRLPDMVGGIVDRDSIEDKRIGVVPLNKTAEDLMNELVNHGFKLEPRYIGKTNINNEGMQCVTNMRIFSFDILNPARYEDSQK